MRGDYPSDNFLSGERDGGGGFVRLILIFSRLGASRLTCLIKDITYLGRTPTKINLLTF